MQGDDNEEDITTKIKKFLASDSNFRNPSFDPAPFLIQILKQQEADHDRILSRQNELIQLQNEAQELIEEVANEYTQQFDYLIDVPQRYGQQLEKLRNNVSSVKKKVKETKTLLMNTQKDIQQLHLNCIFNKTVYKKLKEIQLKLNQYETASLALKNNQFLICSLNLPYSQGNSLLQSTLGSRAQTLRLRMLSKAIQQMNLFVYLTPKAIFPSLNSLLERTQKGEMILNESQHYPFYKRYQLFKKAYCEDYLAEIWKFDDLDRKLGKIGFIYDIIRGVMNIGKLDQISQSLQLNCKKSIANVYLLMQYLYAKEYEPGNKKPKDWFFRIEPQKYKTFISNVLCISGSILRKFTIVRKIYKQFQVPFLFNNGKIYQIILNQLKNLIMIVFFPGLCSVDILDRTQSLIRQKLINNQNYVYFTYVASIIQNSLIKISHNLSFIEETEFGEIVPQLSEDGNKFLEPFNNQFAKLFHSDYLKTLGDLFKADGRVLMGESYEIIIQSRYFSEQERQFTAGYCSDDKKAIKEHICIVSLLRELTYLKNLKCLNIKKYFKYVLFTILFFYLKISFQVFKYSIQAQEQEKIQQFRKNDKKIKNKEATLEKVYYKLCSDKNQNSNKLLRKRTIIQKSQFNDFKMIEKLKLLKRQNQMFFTFSQQSLQYIEQFKNSQGSNEYQNQINNLQSGNIDETKLNKIWDQLPSNQTPLCQATASVFKKFFNLHMTINAKIYMETGIY